MEIREMTVKKEKHRREFKIEQSRRGTADWQIYTQVSRQLSLTSSFSCFWCVIRIIFGVFSWFVSVSYQNKWRRLPCCSDRPAEKEKQPQKFLLLPDPSGSMKFNYKHFFSPIKTALTGVHKCTYTSARSQAPTGPDLHIQIHAHRDAHTKHTCVWATGLAPLFSCERKKRMDMKSSWMQTRNSSSFWPPVANENRRRDWMMYLKMYSLAWRTERTIIVYYLCYVMGQKKKKTLEVRRPFQWKQFMNDVISDFSRVWNFRLHLPESKVVQSCGKMIANHCFKSNLSNTNVGICIFFLHLCKYIVWDLGKWLVVRRSLKSLNLGYTKLLAIAIFQDFLKCYRQCN